MALKIEIRGILKEYSDVIKLQNGKYRMYITILRPADTNKSGERKGGDNYYRIIIWRNKPEDFNKIKELLRCKVSANVYLNGRRFSSNRINEVIHVNELRLNGDLSEIKS